MKLRIPFIDLSKQHRLLGAELKKAVGRVIDSQQFVLRDSVAALEAQVAQKTGARYAVGLASGSDALFLALLAAGVGPGDEVITTPFTFFATAGSISRTGARPVFADIDPETFNINPVQIRKRITRKTKAIVPVHLFGLCCDMNPILKAARERSLAVIEDAAQSLGAFYGKKPAGSMGNAGCFSFYPTKNLGGAGDGGMLVTSSPKLAETVRLLRDHGSRKKYYHETVGINSRLDEIQAAVLLVKLKHLDRWNAARRRFAKIYDEGLKGLPLKTPKIPAGFQSIYHIYSVLSPQRDALADFLKKKGVGSGVYYPLPLHLQPCYKNLNYRKGDFPVSEKTAANILGLPMYPELGESSVRQVVSVVREFYKKS